MTEATRMLGAFMASNPYRPKKVLAVEMPFTVQVGRHPVTGEQFTFEEAISGVFDLVIENDDGVMVVDHKITKRRPVIDGGVDLHAPSRRMSIGLNATSFTLASNYQQQLSTATATSRSSLADRARRWNKRRRSNSIQRLDYHGCSWRLNLRITTKKQAGLF